MRKNAVEKNQENDSGQDNRKNADLKLTSFQKNVEQSQGVARHQFLVHNFQTNDGQQIRQTNFQTQRRQTFVFHRVFY